MLNDEQSMARAEVEELERRLALLIGTGHSIGMVFVTDRAVAALRTAMSR